MLLHTNPSIYERILHQDDSKDIQVRLVINTFRGVEYLHVRKYYRDFEGLWCPSTEGVAYPIDFENSKELFTGLVEILSLAESKDILSKHFKEILDDIYLK